MFDRYNFSPDGLFYGWDWLVLLITILSALGGLVVSAVVKYADNVKKTYCQSIAIVGEYLLSLLGVSLIQAPQSFPS